MMGIILTEMDAVQDVSLKQTAIVMGRSLKIAMSVGILKGNLLQNYAMMGFKTMDLDAPQIVQLNCLDLTVYGEALEH